MGGQLGGGKVVRVVKMRLEGSDMTKLESGARKITAHLVVGLPDVAVRILLNGDAGSRKSLVKLLVFFTKGLLEKREGWFVIGCVVEDGWTGVVVERHEGGVGRGQR